MSSLIRASKDQLSSKSSSQKQDTIVLVHQYEFLEHLASCLSFSCLVLAKKITLFCCQCFSKTAPELSYPSPPLSDSLESQSPTRSSSQDFREVENNTTSFININFEDPELISNLDQDHLEFSDHELDRLSSFVPSPPLKDCCVLSTNSWDSEIIPLETSEIFEDLNCMELEPLFWPLEKKLPWSVGQETWDFFNMSPPKDGETSQTRCEAFYPLFEEREISGCSLGSQASRLTDNNTSMSSRSSISRTKSLEFETEKDEIMQDYKLNSTCYLDSDLLEEEFKEEELSIELLLGLGEFDGHEGVDIEFNQNNFSLGDSLS